MFGLDFQCGNYFDCTPVIFSSLLVVAITAFVVFALTRLIDGIAIDQQRLRQSLLFAIIAVGAVRVGYALILDPGVIILSDGYYQRAVNLYEGLGFLNEYGNPTALFMPGYSALLAMTFHVLGGPSFIAIVVLQTCLGLASMAVVYYLAKATFDQFTGLIAALIIGLFPSQIILASFAQSDLLFEVVLWTALAVFVYASRNLDSPLKLHLLFSGLLFGMASLTRPYGLVVLTTYSLWCVFINSKRQALFLVQSVRPLAVVIVTAFLLHGMWVIRNYRVFDSFVPFSTAGGINLWVANNPDSTGRYDGVPWEFYSAAESREELALDQELGQKAREYIISNPLEVLKRLPRKWIFLFGSDTTLLGQVLANANPQVERWKNHIAGFANGYYLSIFSMAILFTLKSLKFLMFNVAGSFGIVLFLILLLIFSFFHVETRFHMPFIPAIAIYAAAFVRRVLLHSQSTVTFTQTLSNAH